MKFDPVSAVGFCPVKRIVCLFDKIVYRCGVFG
jgi:hypothetical protein